MADVFISYSKQDPEPTRELAHELERLGYSVWWDTNLIAGANFRKIIDKELADAKAVIVIWTASSVNSDWVISEADRARAARKLIPLRVPAVGPHDIPMPFGMLHTEVIGDVAPLVQSLLALGVAPVASMPGTDFCVTNDQARAIGAYTRLIKLDPSAKAYCRRGNALRAMGDLDRAIADYYAAIFFDPSYADAYYNRGIAFEEMGRRKDAIADFSRALTIDPSHQRSMNALRRLGVRSEM